ncbi:unnamed protein product [Rotaria sordida]|uniref:Uncharacterized protein n=1 Tax=Rotaria sordida TaxID=392033 RepID=A0A819JJH8_9BILA|nr:unnamed protein product [Rotaria sordida]CAF1035212.1 unnamed protein product [Rotaria sordida]CAF1097660.1 unnamed protein product [Rotaria sordida]CAF1161592.1 unnamed protein product [Rotaria sordida]CAF1411369.1 unnamed protein product [Rotaria sordida]
MKKRQQQKHQNSNKLINSNQSSEIITKKFSIFVTDFLTDPCGLPAELKDCILVDETNEDIYLSNKTQVLKKQSLQIH